MKGKLNLFQIAMLRWRALHPYNAVHVVRFAQPIDAAHLEASLREELESLGLTGLDLDASGRRFEWRGGPMRPPLRVIAAGGDAALVLSREIERELNTGFAADGRVEAFRFFAVDAGADFCFGLAYDHWVAGGDSIVALMQGLVARYLGAPVQSAPTQVLDRRYGPTYLRLFQRHSLALLKSLAGLPRLALNCRHAFRPRYAAPQDGYNAFALARIDPADRARLDVCASAWGVTSHDLLLAMLIRALSPFAKRRLEVAGRDEIAIASIVNIRRDFGPPAAAALAPYLASFRVSHRAPDDLPLRELAAAIQAQTALIKHGKRYLQTLVAMGIVGMEWRFMTPRQRQRFFPKHYPVCAGTTPLQVDRIWTGGGVRPRGPDYIRAVSTGPLAPMILAFTMVGDAINVGITYRTTVFHRDAVDDVAASMLQSIRTLST
jgi:hypothetical protein